MKNRSKKDKKDKKILDAIFSTIENVCDAINEEEKRKEETKKKLREEFETEEKHYNRGTVIAAMAKRGFDSWDMDRVLEGVTNSEKAEAAVGLVESGRYDSWDIARILDQL